MAPMVWTVLAPFLVEPRDSWICDFVESDLLSFVKVPQSEPEQSWHAKKVARTGVTEWRRFAQVGRRALQLSNEAGGGCVTVFPQLAAATGLQKQLTKMDVPIVAWFFNTNLGEGLQRSVARKALAAIDRFVVHSSVEIEAYATDLSLPESRFVYAPVQYGGVIQTDDECQENPFVFATGSGFRDYRTMFAAVEKLGFPTKVVAGERILEGLEIPGNVEVLNGLTRSEIHALVRQARVNVVPLTTAGLTAGIITIVQTFHHGRGIVVTRRSGLEDYISHGHNSLEVAPEDATDMAQSIAAMWEEPTLRKQLGDEARSFALLQCSDSSAAKSLSRILGEFL